MRYCPNNVTVDIKKDVSRNVNSSNSVLVWKWLQVAQQSVTWHESTDDLRPKHVHTEM